MTTDEQPQEENSTPAQQQPAPQPEAEATKPVDDAIQESSTAPVATVPVTEVPAAQPVSVPEQVSESAPTPSVAEILATTSQEVPSANSASSEEAPQAESELAPKAAVSPVSAEQQLAEQPTEASERPAAKLREKLGVKGTDKPMGSEDIKAQRPDVPTNAEPVDIPGSDELDASLEAEIASALGEETSKAHTAAVPAGETSDAESGQSSAAEEIGPGSKITGAVQHVHGDDIFINAGLRSDVVVSSKQFPEDKQPKVGDQLTVIIETIDDDGLFRARIPQAKTKSGGNWDGLAIGQVVDCMVTGTNKGGLEVTVSNLKAFLPASQVDLGFISNMEQYVGQKLTVQITEVKPKKRNLVVSRKALLQAERDAQQADFWKTIEVNQDYTGTVKTIKNYGAFVNIGPIDGFLHVGEISWSRISHPNEVLKEGQEVQVRILKVDPDKKRISLGMKQLVQNPWQGLSDRYPSERIVNGTVSRVADFGAFVELEPGVEGLVHISELAWRRVGSVGEVLKVGDEKDFKVLEVDSRRKRVSLSLKALEQKPESVKKAEEEEESRPVRKPNTDLRGGMGQNSGAGGLFGNPSDFS